MAARFTLLRVDVEMKKCLAAILFSALVAGGCNGKTQSSAPDASSNVLGKRSLDGTYVVNSTHDPSGAPAGMYAPHREQQTLSVTAAEGESTFNVSYVESGESFVAHESDHVLQAQNADVAIDPNGRASASGRTSRTVGNFRWDPAQGGFQLTARDVTNVPGGGQGLGFDDLRVVGVTDASRRWVHYRADTNFPWDFQHGAACVIGGKDTAEGNLGLTYGATHNDLSVYVQGIGCTITPSSTDGNEFSATNADCPLDPVMSVATLGILSWTFESFTLDLAGKHVSFVARATRKRDDAQIVDLCLKLDSDLTGDLQL